MGVWAEPEAARGAVRKVGGEFGDILQALAEGREHDGEDGDAIPEVFPEGMFPDHHGEVAVRGGDDAHVHMERSCPPPTRSKTPSCTTRRRRTCAAAGKLADFIEEEGAAVGAFEPAAPRTRCAGEVLLWPKSSESMSSWGMAPQFTRIKGPLDRGELSWIARATTSSPGPAQDEHGVPERDTRAARSSTERRPPFAPMIPLVRASTESMKELDLSASAASRSAMSSLSRRSFSSATARGSEQFASWASPSLKRWPGRALSSSAPRVPVSRAEGQGENLIAESLAQFGGNGGHGRGGVEGLGRARPAPARECGDAARVQGGRGRHVFMEHGAEAFNPLQVGVDVEELHPVYGHWVGE